MVLQITNWYAIQPYNQKELHILEQVLAEKGIDPNPIVQYLREMHDFQLDQGFHDAKPVDDIDEAKREPGTVWKTKTGWAGKNAAGESQYGMDSEEAAKAYVAGKEEKPTKTKLEIPGKTEKERKEFLKKNQNQY